MLEELLQSLDAIRKKVSEYEDSTKPFPESPNVFAMMYNDVTLTVELLNHYYRLWKKPVIGISPEMVEQVKNENAERVLVISKWSFVSTLSSIEWHSKEIMRLTTGDLFSELKQRLLNGKRVYLSNIMERSKSLELIDEKKYETWQGIIAIRNTVVHNNGIASRDAKYEIDGLNVSFTGGEVVTGKLNFFVRLIEVAVDRYCEWLKLLAAQQA